MPTYRVTDPTTGKRVVLKGDSPPTEQELIQIFDTLNGKGATAKPAADTGETPAVVGGSTFGMPNWMLQKALVAIGQPENWPALAATAGGAIGAAGGTAFGMGFGGVPGAVGGAALGGAAGDAARQLADRALGRAVTQPASSQAAAGQIARQGALQGAAELAGAGITAAAGAGARAVYRGYLKPSLAARNIGKAREVVDTALREALPVTQAGEARAVSLINDLNTEVNTILHRTNGTVDLHQVADRVRAFAKRKYFRPGVDLSDYKAALDVADSIDQHAALGLPPGATPTRVTVSAEQANEVKQAVRPNSRAYGQQGAAPEAATRKVAGHELRTAIENIAPEVGPQNARERQIIDALDAITHAAGREENRSALFGVPTMIAGAAGAGEGYRQGDPTKGLITALTVRGLLTPAVATRAAILASRFARVPGTAPATAVRMAIQLIEQGGSAPADQLQPPQ